MAKIEKLTDEQIARFPEYVEKWTRIGLSTEPGNFEIAARGIAECYEVSGLKPPARIVAVASPLVAVICGPLVEQLLVKREVAPLLTAMGFQVSGVRGGVSSGVWSGVWSGVESGVESGVWSGVRGGVESGVWSEVSSGVSSGVESGVRSGVSSGVESGVRSGVRGGVESGVESGVRSGVRGGVWGGVESGVWGGVESGVSSGVSSGVESGVRSGVESGVWGGVESGVSSGVSSGVESGVWSEVSSGVSSGVESGVRSGVSSGVESGVRSGVIVGWQDFMGGHFWAAWQSFQSYLREVCGLQLDHKLERAAAAYQAVAENAGYWWPGTHVAYVSARPTVLCVQRDSRNVNVLHSESSPSIAWADGFALWHIAGVAVDEQIVMRPETQTVEQIRGEQNEEIKRIRIERFGWPRYLQQINASVIDRRRNDIDATEESLMRTPEGMTIFVPTCKTGRVFSLEVPPQITTCEQAQAWLHSGSRVDELVRKTRVIGRT